MRIVFSRIMDADNWTDTRSYYFPFAEKIARRKGGWLILKTYLTIRMWLEQ